MTLIEKEDISLQVQKCYMPDIMIVIFLAGRQVDDNVAQRSTSRISNPPGGKSNIIF